MANNLIIRGNVEILVESSEGEELQRFRAQNRIVDNGLNFFRDLAGGIVGRPDVQAIGIGTTAPAATDTALESSVLSKTIDRRLDTDKTITFQTIFLESEANGYTISEVGLFGSSVLIARALITPTVAKTSAIQLTISHEVTLSYEA